MENNKIVKSNPRSYVMVTGDSKLSDGKSLEDFKAEGNYLVPVAVSMDGSDISLVKLNDGSLVNKDMAVELCDSGLLPGFITGHSKYGEGYVRGVGDGDLSNNLMSLPRF